MAKKHNWEVALEKAQAKSKAPKSETPTESPKAPTRQFTFTKVRESGGSTLGNLKYDPSNPVHQELVSRTDLHDKIFIGEKGPMVDTDTYRKLSHSMKMRRLRSK